MTSIWLKNEFRKMFLWWKRMKLMVISLWLRDCAVLPVTDFGQLLDSVCVSKQTALSNKGFIMNQLPLRKGSRPSLTHLATLLLAFTVTGTAFANGPQRVELGTAGNYVILAKTGISTVPPSKVKGDIGASPVAATYITGFSLIEDPSNTFWTSSQIIGRAFAADNAVPTPSLLTVAVRDMENAYTDAAGRSRPDFVELASGSIGGLTLAPGLYKWTTGISILKDVTISGGPNDVWVLQTTGNLSMGSIMHVILAGGAQAKNIFWQVAGNVAIGTGAHFEGILLCKTDVTLLTRATMNGRILSQTAAVLQKATVTKPALVTRHESSD